MGSLADRAASIVTASTLPAEDDRQWGEPIGEFRHWLRERDVPVPAGLTEVNADDVDPAIDSGARLLVLRGPVADDLVTRSIVAVLTGCEPNVLIAEANAATDAAWMQQVVALRDMAAHLRVHLGDPEAMVQASPAVAAMTSAVITASARRTPLLLEGLTAWTAALAADRLSFRAKTWWHGAGTSIDPAIAAAALRIGIPTGLDLRLPTESVLGARVHAAVTAID